MASVLTAPVGRSDNYQGTTPGTQLQPQRPVTNAPAGAPEHRVDGCARFGLGAGLAATGIQDCEPKAVTALPDRADIQAIGLDRMGKATAEPVEHPLGQQAGHGPKGFDLAEIVGCFHTDFYDFASGRVPWRLSIFSVVRCVQHPQSTLDAKIDVPTHTDHGRMPIQGPSNGHRATCAPHAYVWRRCVYASIRGINHAVDKWACRRARWAWSRMWSQDVGMPSVSRSVTVVSINSSPGSHRPGGLGEIYFSHIQHLPPQQIGVGWVDGAYEVNRMPILRP